LNGCLLFYQPKIKTEMKKNITNLSGSLMKILSLTIMLAFIAPVMTHAQAGKVNFAGNWVLNAEKSTQPPAGGQGGGRGFGGGNFVAKQEGTVLTVTRTRTGQDGQVTTTNTIYNLDGKESVNTTGRGDAKSTAKWSADGKTLTIVTNSTFTGQDGTARTMTATAEWTLTDAKTLTVKTSRPGQNGETTTTTMVYDLK
jgi:dipeptidyl aminopeptidase/acylaminoacyl peptidase